MGFLHQRREDIYTSTAAEVFKVDPQMVTADMRFRSAKAVNFGALCTGRPWASPQTLCSHRKGKPSSHPALPERYAGVREFIDRRSPKRKNQVAKLSHGRWRPIPEPCRANSFGASFAERTVVILRRRESPDLIIGDVIRVAPPDDSHHATHAVCLFIRQLRLRIATRRGDDLDYSSSNTKWKLRSLAFCAAPGCGRHRTKLERREVRQSQPGISWSLLVLACARVSVAVGNPSNGP